MPSRHRGHGTPVGLAEVAEHLGLPANRVQVWHHRTKHGKSVPVPWPPPRWEVANGPLWCLECDIEPVSAQLRGKQAEHP